MKGINEPGKIDLDTVPTFNSCPGIMHDRTTYCQQVSWQWMYGCMDELATENNFDSQATRVIDVLGLSLDMLSMGV